MRTTIKTALAAALALLAAGGGAAEAQGENRCQGRLFLNTIYRNGTGGQNQEYFIQIRNGTGTPIRANVVMGGFPRDVTLFSPQLPDVPTPGNSLQTIRIGRGTNAGINAGTVDLLHDRNGSGRPFVSLQNCRQG